MPGRGGRSKACGNCYRRRIKCDETKPKCLKCIKAKLECVGYQPLTILSYDGSREQWDERPIGDKNTGSVNGSLANQSLQHVSTDFEAEPGILDKIFAFELKPAADDVFINYTLNSMLSAGSQYKAVTGVHRDLSDKTFLALSTFFFGNEHKNQKVVQYGLLRYGKVLQKLNAALGDSKKRRTYDILESVIIATMLEFLMSDRPDGWISHAVGIERLFAHKGPYSFTLYAERSVLERSRPSIIFASLALRRPTILSKPEWKTVPWESALESKSLFEHLVDIMVDCPQLLILQDKMNAADGDAIAKTHACDLCIQASTVRERLSEWKQQWNVAEPDCRHENPNESDGKLKNSRTRIELADHHYPRFEYKSLYHANAMTLYNAIFILTEVMLQSTINVGGIEPQLVGTDAESADAALFDIVRSVDYCIDHARDGLGSFYIMFPIRMAWAQAKYRGSELKVWLEATLRSIQLGAAGHWAVAGYLLSICDGPGSAEREIGVGEVDHESQS